MPTEPNWLDAREDRAWRAFMHANHRLSVRLNQLLLENAGLTQGDYQILAVLSGHPEGRMPAREACDLLQWEKSRLSHQVRHLQEQGLVALLVSLARTDLRQVARRKNELSRRTRWPRTVENGHLSTMAPG